MVRLAAFILVLSIPVSAAGPAAMPPSFEGMLNAIHLQVRQTRAAQVQEKSKAEIERLSWDVSRLNSDLWQLRNDLRDIARRVQRRGPSQPGRPDQDPFLRNDIQRLVWNLRDMARFADRAERDVQRLISQASKDPEQVQPAQNLLSEAQRMSSETRWLESDGRNVGWDLRRAGYNMEAWDVERESGGIATGARNLENASRALLEKVR